jgi:hypothetical protein
MLLVGVLAFGASTASAGTVSWFGGCYQNGAATTTAGPLQLKFGWFTQRVGQLNQFLNVQYVTYQISGSAPVSTAVGQTVGWTKAAPTVNGETPPKSGYVSYYTTPVIATLTSGQSITVTFSVTTTATTRDADAGTPIPAQTFGLRTCTITAGP